MAQPIDAGMAVRNTRDMNTTAAREALTTIGADVEVEVTDFASAGMPRIWVRATVVAVEAAGRLFDISVARHDVTDKNSNPLVQSVRIGPRAGNKQIRIA